MTTLFRLRRGLFEAMQADLRRPHRTAAERVGFVYGPMAILASGTVLVLPTHYDPVPDDEYLDDPSVGACISTPAMRRAVQRVLTSGACCFHVHLHDWAGEPRFSPTDIATIEGLGPALHAVSRGQHGGLVLSTTGASAKVWRPDRHALEGARVSIVGAPLWLGTEPRTGGT